MTFWLGKPGALVALPPPRKGIDPTAVRTASVARTIGGGQIVSRPPGPGRRTYQLSWSGLTADQYSLIESLYTGAAGRGPFALLDPGRRNLLAANQASTGSVTATPDGFTVDPTELVTTSPEVWTRGPRSLRWVLPATVTAGVLDLTAPTGMVGWPAPAAQPWTFSGSLTVGGLAPVVAVTPVLSWRRVDGSQISTTTGTPTTPTPGAWSTFTVTGTPPAGAVAVRPQLSVPVGVLATAVAGVGIGAMKAPPTPYRPPAGYLAQGGRSLSTYVVDHPPQTQRGSALVMQGLVPTVDLYVDQLQLDANATARPWVAGTGVPLVTFTGLSELYKTVPFHSCSATLVEVG